MIVYILLCSPSRPDIYGLINLLYLKADGDLNGQITESELSDVFKGFDKNGLLVVSCSLYFYDTEVSRGKFRG